jgi:hypothetical protein
MLYIYDSRGKYMFWNNKIRLLEKRAADIFKCNIDYGEELDRRIHGSSAKGNILIVLEIYAYLNCLSDFFFNKNHVDNDLRRKLFEFSWQALTNTKRFSSLTLNQDEINKFIDNRIENYTKIMNKYKLSAEYFENIVQYHLQLISGIINENRISFYNPLPENLWDYSPINLDILQNLELNNILHDFMIDRIMPYLKLMNANFGMEYFTNKNYKYKT